MKKILCLILSILTVILASGCEKTPEPSPDTESDTGELQQVQEPLQLVVDGKTEYEVIYPETAEPIVMSAVEQFREAFRTHTGISIKTADDYLKEGETHQNDTCKILIGMTNYEESEAVFSDLRYCDYCVTVRGTHMIVAAYTADAYTEAINWLSENVFSKTTNKGALTMEAQTVSESMSPWDYPIESWKIAGVDLKQYQLVYGESEQSESVKKLQQIIGEQTGYYLKAVLDSQSTLQQYEILIGETNREESTQVDVPTYLNYVFEVVNEKLVIKAGGEHSLIKVLEDFVVLTAQDSSKVNMGKNYRMTGDFYTDPLKTSMPENADLRFMTANLQAEVEGYNGDVAEGFAFERRLEIFLSALEFYRPTVVGVQECCPTWYKGIKASDGFENWDILEFQNPKVPTEKVFSTIMYRKDLLMLVDSGMQYYSQYNNGRCRCVTWAVLKIKATGEEFCFVSTHWDGGGTDKTLVQANELVAFVNQMAETYPVFTTGDFNSNETTVAFKTLLADAESVDCMHAAQNRLNQLGSWHGWGKDTASAGSCDHITATKDVTVLQFETLIYNEQIYASDHSWLIADIAFH